MPFERKNKEEKEIAVATTSNKNLPLTLAIQNQLHNAHIRENLVLGIASYYTFGPIENNDITSFILHRHLPSINMSEQTFKYKHLTFANKKYQEGTVVFFNVDDDEPQFGIISSLYKTGQHISLRIECMNTLRFNKHYHAYEVDLTNKFAFIDFEKLPKIAPVLLIKKTGKNYVITRHDL
ncbi:hypothetical protein TKK_0012362 [Trichogramma kaykai]|uniref:Uncharacterized protein n=2 Tax=Trichogramma kaykai TaxID=54128 RepID=A0ABD2WNL1_9HYME